MPRSTGLRERQKQQTRQLIHETASRLFAGRGFDAVTVAEVARAADVSEMTVFNHFPTKEDLFFNKMEFFEERLIGAVRDRAEGVSVLNAFRRLVVDSCAGLSTQERVEAIRKAAALVGASPTLQIREREIVANYTKLLAELLAAEMSSRPDDVEPWGVAGALMTVHRALVGYVRVNVLAGKRGPKLAADARMQARRAFARLESGLADYALKRN